MSGFPQINIPPKEDVDNNHNKNVKQKGTNKDESIEDDHGKLWKYLDRAKLKCYTRRGIVPEDSVDDYIKWYNVLMKFLNNNNKENVDEDSIIEWFEWLKNDGKYAASSIFTIFSCAKKLLIVTTGTDCNKYYFAKEWLKKNAKNFVPKQAPIFEERQWREYIEMDDVEMKEKTASIYGRFGRFRAIDYTNQYYNQFIREYNGTAVIKLFERGMLNF